MQLKYKISLITASLLMSSTLNAENYVRVNYMQYNESDNRVDVLAPSIELNRELGVDYTLNLKLVLDAVSGATPIYSDTSSGASAYNRGEVDDTSDIKKENVEFDEQRKFTTFSVVKRLENRDEITASYSKSYESDYDSNALSVDYLMWANESKNRSYNFGLSYQDNTILIKKCDEYNYACYDSNWEDDDSKSGASDDVSGASRKESATIMSTEVGLTQVIDKTSLAKASLFYSNEDGYLSNPYYNVVRNTNEVVAERRPDKRVASGFNLKYIKSFTSALSSQFKYKYYSDDWDITSHTIDINNYYELSSNYTIGFGIRYYMQSEADFYSDDTTHFTDETYASHDDRLSDFNSQTYKGSIDYKYNDKISYNMGLNFYEQSTGLSATYYSVGFKYKF